ncbi:MAG: aminopeptidase N, partial [Alphaproteobacteria bacterium]|nr:aminopeptidase N [Alphaproteobacteria bacterium]
MRTEEPRAINLKDYRAPDYRISEISLDFVLDPLATRVTAISKVTRTGAAGAPLVLDGEELKLVSIAIDGRALGASDYVLGKDTLTLEKLPAAFALEIVTEISPENNTTLNGLYTSKGMFCTQCEAEGFRRITYFLDRPDNLAIYTTRIEADKNAYPILLSNGN